MNTIPAVFEHGVFRPTVPVSLPEGTRVNIPAPKNVPLRSQSQSARQSFLQLIGSVDLGHALGTNNAEIDRDLSREYGNDR